MNVKIRIEGLKVSFGEREILKGLSIDVFKNRVTGFMGPAGSGKSTLISVINRMIDFEDNAIVEGKVLIDGQDILGDKIDAVQLRRRVGTVFAVPIPLPRSIYDNIGYGPRLKHGNHKKELRALVVESLKKAFLWDEVKDRLGSSALKLSGGQQQRLCLARTLALTPEIILLDEPCSGLDPISTAKIEEALDELKKDYTIILVSNNTKQIARITDYAAFFYMGTLIEYGPTEKVFTNPSEKHTEDYIQGKFG
ncbi:phosphate ABC transporter ATP-binding protein [Syntrophorhabdus aromaticivorans]|uniref:Phosphate ABC transporter ATP-binding protein n=1 Tax=Syntrophorhabdus aromaticivorans TaxID=328301 RepID=A0A351U4D1_9BACT|nr:phosphate ABC transporter ATP-binding protein [Syntrophorhabdus aromaticivorans]NLW34328.1 phosphate ABC transporter ATP-binding protein [Syntrophorhabdus aromaticivorans]HBA54812.1 phosphate ABC transporter ATP-binding protein [Syntrophorhabdus aromaticivorans]